MSALRFVSTVTRNRWIQNLLRQYCRHTNTSFYHKHFGYSNELFCVCHLSFGVVCSCNPLLRRVYQIKSQVRDYKASVYVTTHSFASWFLQKWTFGHEECWSSRQLYLIRARFGTEQLYIAGICMKINVPSWSVYLRISELIKVFYNISSNS